MAQVMIGPHLEPDEEAALQREQASAYADQLAGEVTAIEAKVAGMKEALAAKRAELKAARAAAKE